MSTDGTTVYTDMLPGGEGDHVFHIHGYSVYVVGVDPSVGRQGLDTVKQLDHRGQLFSRSLKSPVVKDTVSVPAGGVVAVRFIADNPGMMSST